MTRRTRIIESEGKHIIERNSIYDPVVRKRFLITLEKIGVLQTACKLHNVNRQTLFKAKREDPEFQEQIDEAIETYKALLEEEAHRRAVEGWDEPVYSQKLGRKIGHIRKFSDRLLELKLKRHIPEYRDKVSVDATVKAGIVVIPAHQKELTDEQWAETIEGTIVDTTKRALPKCDTSSD